MLYLVRHGETVWNAEGRYQGAKDSPLTGKGRAQAIAAGRLLRSQTGGVMLDAYVSPLGRARQTADLIATESPLRVISEPRIAEVSLGSWDGLTDYEIDAEFPGALAGATPFDWFFRSPDGEKLETATARILRWLNEAVQPALVVSHGLTGRLIRGVYLGLTEREMLNLPAPQDGLFRLDGSEAEFLPCDTV